MKSIAIVEDEKNAADELIENLGIFFQNVGVQADIRWFSDPVTFLDRYKAEFDIVFLDIEMPHINGMEVAQRLRKIDAGVMTIFVTNMAQYAVSGYEVSAFDFIVKPVKYPILEFKMKRALECLNIGSDKKILVNIGGGVECIKTDELKYAEVLNHRITYHTVNKDITAYGQLKKLETALPADIFCRCNAYCLVNLRYVTAVKGGTAYLSDEELPISNGKRKDFMRALSEYLGGAGMMGGVDKCMR